MFHHISIVLLLLRWDVQVANYFKVIWCHIWMRSHFTFQFQAEPRRLYLLQGSEQQQQTQAAITRSIGSLKSMVEQVVLTGSSGLSSQSDQSQVVGANEETRGKRLLAALGRCGLVYRLFG